MALGFNAGDAIFIDSQGDYSPFLEDPDGDGTFTQAPERPDNLAIAFADAAPDIVAAQQYTPLYISEPAADGTVRDAAGDTTIGRSGGVLAVPTGAVNLAVGVTDSYFSDNVDADNNLGLVIFRPTVVGFSGNGDLSLTNTARQDAAVIIGANGAQGEAVLDASTWAVSSDLSVGELGGAGRLILDNGSQAFVLDATSSYGVPTDPNVRVGTNSGNGYLAVADGSRVLVGSDLQFSASGAVTGGYDNLQIGTDNGIGAVLVEGEGSTITAYGYSSRISIGEDGGTGLLEIRDGGTVQSLSINAGRRNGEALVVVDGEGSTLQLGGAFGQYGVLAYRGSGSFSTIGRDGGNGQLRVANGGQVRVENVDGLTDGASLRLARDFGSRGEAEVTGAGSRIDIIQNGPQGDNYIAGPALYVGQGGQGELSLSDNAEILIQGDGARLSVARGRDGQGAAEASVLEITSGATLTVDSLGYGVREQVIGTDSNNNPIYRNGGARVDVGSGQNTSGVISVDGAGSSLVLNATSIQPGDYSTGELRLGGFGRGELQVSNGGYVSARELELGVGYIGGGGGPAYAGRGYVSISSGGRVILDTPDNPLKAADPDNQPSAYRGLRLSTANAANYSRVTVDGAGSELTVTGGAGRLDIGRTGTGRIDITNGGLVQGFFIEAGRDGTGLIYVDGAGSQFRSSDDSGEFGYGADNEAAFLRLGRNGGSYGKLQITNGGNVTLENGAGSLNDSSILELGRALGAQGVLEVTGGTLDIRLNGPSTDGDGAGGAYKGPELRLGREGGSGQVTVAAGGIINIDGENAELLIGRGADGNGNTAQSRVAIYDGGTINVQSLG